MRGQVEDNRKQYIQLLHGTVSYSAHQHISKVYGHKSNHANSHMHAEND